jgi:peroxiredoxin
MGAPRLNMERNIRMIKVGDTLPAVSLTEYVPFEGEGCAVGPNAVKLPDAVQGKTVAIFAVPGAFTPTCSEKHLPGYLEQLDALKAKGVDEVWCVATNDAFVMGAWAKASDAEGKIRFMGDGSAEFTKAIGLTLDLTARGLGVRSTRYSMLVKDGKVAQLNVEEGGALKVSDASTLLSQLG